MKASSARPLLCASWLPQRPHRRVALCATSSQLRCCNPTNPIFARLDFVRRILQGILGVPDTYMVGTHQGHMRRSDSKALLVAAKNEGDGAATWKLMSRCVAEARDPVQV